MDTNTYRLLKLPGPYHWSQHRPLCVTVGNTAVFVVDHHSVFMTLTAVSIMLLVTIITYGAETGIPSVCRHVT